MDVMDVMDVMDKFKTYGLVKKQNWLIQIIIYTLILTGIYVDNKYAEYITLMKYCRIISCNVLK